MSETVNLDVKFSGRIDKAFTLGSLVQPHVSDSCSFVGARTVRIHRLGRVPLGDYSRTASANRYGVPAEVGDTLEELTLSQDKSFSAIIDKGNDRDTAMSRAGEFLAMELGEEMIPAYDRYCFSKLARYAGRIAASAEAVSASNVIARLAAARKYLLDHRVPAGGRTLFVTTEVFNALCGTDQFKQLQAPGTAALEKGVVGELFGAKVVEVPADLMPAGCNFILLHHLAATAPRKLNETKMHLDPPGISGSLCEGRFYYDLFVFAARADGVYADVTTDSSVTVPDAPVIAADGSITAASGCTVKYTTDGSDPRYSASAQFGTSPAAESGTVVKAVQYKEGGYLSAVAEAVAA